MQLLQIGLVCGSTRETIISNLEHNQKLGLPMLGLEAAKEGVVSICGGGPSLKNTIDELTGEIWALNSTHDFLISQGVTPDVGFFWDAHIDTLMHANNPNRAVRYYVASHCHPKLLERLEGYNVTLFHAEIGYEIQDDLGRMNWHAPIFWGGSAAATRAPFIAYAQGFREIHIHGIDGSYNGNSHVDRDDQDFYDITDVEVECLGKKFNTTGWMAIQAQEIVKLYNKLSDAAIVVHGEGLVPHVATVNGFHYSQLRDMMKSSAS